MSRVQIALQHVEDGMATATDAEILRQEISQASVMRVALSDELHELRMAVHYAYGLYGGDEFESALTRLARLVNYPGI